MSVLIKGMNPWLSCYLWGCLRPRFLPRLLSTSFITCFARWVGMSRPTRWSTIYCKYKSVRIPEKNVSPNGTILQLLKALSCNGQCRVTHGVQSWCQFSHQFICAIILPAHVWKQSIDIALLSGPSYCKRSKSIVVLLVWLLEWLQLVVGQNYWFLLWFFSHVKWLDVSEGKMGKRMLTMAGIFSNRKGLLVVVKELMGSWKPARQDVMNKLEFRGVTTGNVCVPGTLLSPQHCALLHYKTIHK